MPVSMGGTLNPPNEGPSTPFGNTRRVIEELVSDDREPSPTQIELLGRGALGAIRLEEALRKKHERAAEIIRDMNRLESAWAANQLTGASPFTITLNAEQVRAITERFLELEAQSHRWNYDSSVSLRLLNGSMLLNTSL